MVTGPAFSDGLLGISVMLIGFQCSESPGPTGGELGGSLRNSMGPDSPV